MTEIAAIAGQKILCSKRGSIMLCSEVARSEKYNNKGDISEA
jgi:hypothetical protein